MPHDLSQSADKFLTTYDAVAALAEQDRAHKDQARQFLLSLLEVADSIERLNAAADAVAVPTTEHALQWRRTFQLVGRQLQATLASQGVAPMECVGQLFDPDCHNAVEIRPCPGAQEGLIVEALIGGYLLNQQPLRTPQVVIASKPPQQL